MLKKNKKLLVLLKPLKSVYTLILIAFIIWMSIFDTNSWLIHSELNKDINTLNSKIEFYSTEIAKDKKASGKQKLLDLGLTEEEVQSLINV